MQELNLASKIRRGCQKFHNQEKRDAMYKIANYLVSHFWQKSDADATNGLGVLLFTWNQAFYRYGSFDFDALEEFIKQNKAKLDRFRNRTIESFGETDKNDVNRTFQRTLGCP
jgi:hypothetical protein